MHRSHHIVNGVRRSLLVLGAAMLVTVWAGVAPKAKGEPAAAQATVDDAACRQVVAHRPAQGVAYRPGAEKGVVPADLSAGMTLEPKDYVIDLRFPLNDVAPGRAERLTASELTVGTVAFDQGDGVLLNGQPAADPAAHAIAAICAARHPAR
jgi:hypothetical protein